MSFQKYIHLERFGTSEVKDINLGEVHVFHKLDGTNACAWLDQEGNVCAGSRNRELTVGNDNAGFCKWVGMNTQICGFLRDNKELILYGEFLVPHTFRGYVEEAWKRFYVFDVYNTATKSFMSYDEYKPLLEKCDLDYVPRITILINPTEQQLKELMPACTFMTQGEQSGEGIVIKNYEYINKYGRQTWAKMINHIMHTTKGSNRIKKEASKSNIPLEELFVTIYVDEHLVGKCIHKCCVLLNIPPTAGSDTVTQAKVRKGALIPRTLNMLWKDVVDEELWDFIKKHKWPTLNFKRLKNHCDNAVRNILFDKYAHTLK